MFNKVCKFSSNAIQHYKCVSYNRVKILYYLIIAMQPFTYLHSKCEKYLITEWKDPNPLG